MSGVHTPDEYVLRSCAAVREGILSHYPPAVARLFRAEYLSRFQREPTDTRPGALSRIGKVNQWLRETHKNLVGRKPHIAYNADEIEHRAELAARYCSRAKLDGAIAYTLSRGVFPPRGRFMTQEGIHARLSSRSWWRRALRRTYTRGCENGFRGHAGIVHRQAMPYITDDGAQVYKEHKQRSRTMLAEMQVMNEQGELFSVAELAEKSVSNPKLRRGELMCRVRGFEEVAKAARHQAVFLTMTAPSCYHARHVSGEANERYNGTYVYAAQRWLSKMWARARAKLARLSIYVYGFRVAEPHHDGTPHWHALLWTAPHNVELLCRVIRDHWLSEFADEPGAAEHRFKRIDIDPTKGSAIGYVSKYVAKSIDGHAVGEDLDEGNATGLDSITAAERIEAWARTHGIRQFQQIGGPSVSVWRELRRLRDPMDESAPEELEEARKAADGGQWSEFIFALGGPEYCRRGFVRLWKAPAKQANTYGEQGADRIVGVVCQLRGYRTRVHEWRRVRSCFSRRPGASFRNLGPVSITVRGQEGAGERQPVPFFNVEAHKPEFEGGLTLYE
jgi:hypothetical protein